MVRIKQRYLLVNIIYPPDGTTSAKQGVPHHVVQHQPTTDNLHDGTLAKAIKSEVVALFGDYGAGALGNNLQIKYLSCATSTFIVKCARAQYQMLWAALTFMNRVPSKDGRGRPCVFRVVRVSGTIRKAEEEAIRQAKRLIIAAKEEATPTGSAIDRLPDSGKGDTVDMPIVDDSSDESMDDVSD